VSDENVIKEGTGADGITYRVRMIPDPNPEMPYDDGSVPLWRVDYKYGSTWTAKQVEMTSYEATCPGLGDAMQRWGGPDSHLVARWLKSYHGVTVVETWHSGESWYIAADHEDWRRYTGVTPEQITEQAEKGSLMAEYKAWCEGDGWGYVIESKALAITTVVTPSNGEVVDTRSEEEWVETDATTFGLYGHAYAVEEAVMQFHAHLRDLDKQVNAWRYETVYLNPEDVPKNRPYDGITVNKGEPVSRPETTA
jgi:hypothetical protein